MTLASFPSGRRWSVKKMDNEASVTIFASTDAETEDQRQTPIQDTHVALLARDLTLSHPNG